MALWNLWHEKSPSGHEGQSYVLCMLAFAGFSLLNVAIMGNQPAKSSVRALGVIAGSLLTVQMHFYLEDIIQNYTWRALFVGMLWLQWLKCIDDLCITRASFKRASVSLTRRLAEAADFQWNYRGIGTKWQISKLRRFKSADTRRAVFFIQHTLTYLVAALVLDIASSQKPPPPETFTLEKEHLISRYDQVDANELLARFASTAGFWVNIYCIATGIYSLFAAHSVLFHLSHPRAWPPLFGPMREAYSIRQFWGITWHQAFRRVVTDIPSFVSHDMLGVPENTIASRYLRLVMGFALSGFVHHMAVLAPGVPWGESFGTLRFFIAQSVGIAFEDAVQALCRHYNVPISARIKRWLGRMWLVTFLVWMTPVWSYPSIRLAARQRTSLFPVSISGKFMDMLRRFGLTA